MHNLHVPYVPKKFNLRRYMTDDNEPKRSEILSSPFTAKDWSANNDELIVALGDWLT